MTPSNIVVLSDLHQDLEGIDAIAPALAEADLVLLAGDLTHNGGRDAVRRVVDAVRRHARRVLAVHGNCDRADAAAWLADQGISLHRRAVRLGDLALFGVGGSTPTPMKTPTEYAEEEIAAFLGEAAEACGDAPRRLAVVHVPPRDTPLDRMILGLHVGSRACRAFLEAAQPDAAVSGHIHESRAVARVGRTLCVNPGGFLGHWRWAELRLGGDGFAADLRQPASHPGRLARVARLVRRVAS